MERTLYEKNAAWEELSMEERNSMEQNFGLWFTADKTEAEAGNYSPLVLAFLGDAVYELAVRTMLVKPGNARPNQLNRKKSQLVRAEAQSAMMAMIEPELTEAEEAVYHRGRNAKSYTSAKNASITDYRRATGFEALIGYLYLSGQTDRMYKIIALGIAALQA